MAASTENTAFCDAQRALCSERQDINDLDRVEAVLGDGAVRFQMGPRGLTRLFKAKADAPTAWRQG